MVAPLPDEITLDGEREMWTEKRWRDCPAPGKVDVVLGRDWTPPDPLNGKGLRQATLIQPFGPREQRVFVAGVHRTEVAGDQDRTGSARSQRPDRRARNALLSNRQTKREKPLSSYGLTMINQIITEFEDPQHSRVTDQITVTVNVAGTTADRRR